MEKREITGVQEQVNNIEVIFKEYYGSLCYFASRFLKNEEVIEDLVQDVFIALLEKKMLFQSEVHLKNFLYLSIRNSCLNYIRSTRSKDRYIASLAHEEQTEDLELKNYRRSAGRSFSFVIFKGWIMNVLHKNLD